MNVVYIEVNRKSQTKQGKNKYKTRIKNKAKQVMRTTGVFDKTFEKYYAQTFCDDRLFLHTV